jgi:hypothetical protein
MKSSNRVRVQAVLNKKHIYEVDAVQIYHNLIARGYSARQIVTMALLAYQTMTHEGWQPTIAPSEITLTSDLLKMIHQLQSLANRLATTSSRAPSSLDDQTSMMLEISDLGRQASEILSDVYIIPDDDD